MRAWGVWVPAEGSPELGYWQKGDDRQVIVIYNLGAALAVLQDWTWKSEFPAARIREFGPDGQPLSEDQSLATPDDETPQEGARRVFGAILARLHSGEDISSLLERLLQSYRIVPR